MNRFCYCCRESKEMKNFWLKPNNKHYTTFCKQCASKYTKKEIHDKTLKFVLSCFKDEI